MLKRLESPNFAVSTTPNPVVARPAGSSAGLAGSMPVCAATSAAAAQRHHERSGASTAAASSAGTAAAEVRQPNDPAGPVTDDELASATGVQRLWLRLARVCHRTLASHAFETFITLVICLAGTLVGLQTYPEYADSHALEVVDGVILAIFIAEIVLKAIAKKYRPHAFFTDREMWHWNLFDFLIVLACLIPGPLQEQAALLRLLRLLRVLKLLKMIEMLQVILRGLVAGMRSVVYVVMLLMLIFYLFAILGMMLFKENDAEHFGDIGTTFVTLIRATTLEDWTDLFYTAWFGCENYGYELACVDGRPWGVGAFNTSAIVAYDEAPLLFNIVLRRIHNGSVFDGDELPVATWRPPWLALVYWLSFVVIAALVMLSLFIGAVTIGMQSSLDAVAGERQHAKAALKLRHRKEHMAAIVEHGAEERLIALWAGDVSASRRHTRVKPPTSALLVRYHRLAHAAMRLAEWAPFTHFITVAIVVASVMVGLETDDVVWANLNGCEGPAALADGACDTRVTGGVEMTISVVFTLEVAVKVVAEYTRPWAYLYSAWNVFDLVIVAFAWLPVGGSFVMVLRLLRLLRVLKLVRALPQLQIIVTALVSGLSSIGYVALLLLLMYYIAAILAIILFGRNDPWHFRDLHSAMITLVRISTLEDWTDVMYINMHGCRDHPFYAGGVQAQLCDNRALGFESREAPGAAALFFIGFMLLSAMVMMSLFIGIITTSMESATAEQLEQKETDRQLRQMREHIGLPDTRVEQLREIFDVVRVPRYRTISGYELKWLVHVLQPDLSKVEVQETVDHALDEDAEHEDEEEVSFVQALGVLADLQRSEAKVRAGLDGEVHVEDHHVAHEHGLSHGGGGGGGGGVVGGATFAHHAKQLQHSGKLRRVLDYTQAMSIPEEVGVRGEGLQRVLELIAKMQIQTAAHSSTAAKNAAGKSDGDGSGDGGSAGDGSAAKPARVAFSLEAESAGSSVGAAARDAADQHDSAVPSPVRIAGPDEPTRPAELGRRPTLDGRKPSSKLARGGGSPHASTPASPRGSPHGHPSLNEPAAEPPDALSLEDRVLERLRVVERLLVEGIHLEHDGGDVPDAIDENGGGSGGEGGLAGAGGASDEHLSA